MLGGLNGSPQSSSRCTDGSEFERRHLYESVNRFGARRLLPFNGMNVSCSGSSGSVLAPLDL